MDEPQKHFTEQKRPDARQTVRCHFHAILESKSVLAWTGGRRGKLTVKGNLRGGGNALFLDHVDSYMGYTFIKTH